MNKFEQIASKLISMQEHELAKELERQYKLGWHDGQEALAVEMLSRMVGGHK